MINVKVLTGLTVSVGAVTFKRIFKGSSTLFESTESRFLPRGVTMWPLTL